MLIVSAFKLLPSVTPEIVEAASLDTAIAAEALISAFRIVPSKIMVDVTVPVSPVVIIVPSIFGKLIVLSTVGLITPKVVSKASAEDPSKTIEFPSNKYRLFVIVGLIMINR